MTTNLYTRYRKQAFIELRYDHLRVTHTCKNVSTTTTTTTNNNDKH